MFAAMLIAFDIAFSRFNYHAALQELGPEKLSLTVQYGDRCTESMLYSTKKSPECNQFCEKVRSLAERRREAMMRVRAMHPTGPLAAKIFLRLDKRDDATNKDLYEHLFKDKTCARVLQSVNKSNWKADMWALAFLIVSVLLSFCAL